MKEKILLKKVKLIKEEICRRDNDKELCEELKNLEKNPNVKRYLELCDKVTHDNRKDKDIIYAITRNQNTNSDCKIYIYIGMFLYDKSYDSRSDERTMDKDKADYIQYRNLETDEYENIYPYLADCFEKNYLVIKGNDSFLSDELFYSIQKEYFYKLYKDKVIDDKKFVKMIQRRLTNGSK